MRHFQVSALTDKMATVRHESKEENTSVRDTNKEENSSENEDDILNIYENIEPDDCFHVDFCSGIDLLDSSLQLRDEYDDIESMWTPTEDNHDDIKTAFIKAAETVGETNFTEELVWLASGSHAESSFFSVIYEASESECRHKIFGDNHSGIGERRFEEYVKDSKAKRKMQTLLMNGNDYDYMITPKSLILSNTDCVMRKTDTPGFVKLQLLNGDITNAWMDCCFTSDHCDHVFVSPTLVKKKLERIFNQVEKDGPFIVKQGSVAFQIAHLNNVLGGIRFYDIVFAVKCKFWPSMASQWITRSRTWPSKEDIQGIVDKGFHLVPKVNSLSEDPLDWRVSFSQAEVSLTSLPLVYHYGIIHWRILKSLFSCHLKLQAHPKMITSYTLKTLFLYALERIKYDHWLNKEHLLKSILGILDDLVVCLARHNCPHYFIPEINLFDYLIPHNDFYPLVAEQVLSLRKQVGEKPGKMAFGD